MKAFVSFDFDNPAEFAAFCRHYSVPVERQEVVEAEFTDSGPTPVEPAEGAPQASASPAVEPKPARKPRNDAGKARGPNVRTTGEQGASEPTAGSADSAAAPTVAAPATPTTTLEERNAAARASVQTPPAQPTAAPPSAPAAPAAAGKLTEADARAALKKISVAHGTQACLDYLGKFGVQAITKLPGEMYQQFIAGTDAEIERVRQAKITAAAKAAAK